MSGNFVIAGGSKGIGLELVNRLAENGNTITVYSRDLDELVVGNSIFHHLCDFTDDEIQLVDLPGNYPRSCLLSRLDQFAFLPKPQG